MIKNLICWFLCVKCSPTERSVCNASHSHNLKPSCIDPQITKALNCHIPHWRKNSGKELCITACPVNLNFHSRLRQRYL